MHNKDIGYLIKNINDKLKARADAELKKYDLTLTQSRVIAYLDSCGGQAMQKEIEQHLEVSHPTVAGLVSRMEQNGFVSSLTDENDKRNKIVRLTERAEEVGNEMRQMIMRNEKRMLESLSAEDVKQLRKTLLLLLKNLD